MCSISLSSRNAISNCWWVLMTRNIFTRARWLNSIDLSIVFLSIALTSTFEKTLRHVLSSFVTSYTEFTFSFESFSRLRRTSHRFTSSWSSSSMRSTITYIESRSWICSRKSCSLFMNMKMSFISTSWIRWSNSKSSKITRRDLNMRCDNVYSNSRILELAHDWKTFACFDIWECRFLIRYLLLFVSWVHLLLEGAD